MEHDSWTADADLTDRDITTATTPSTADVTRLVDEAYRLGVDDARVTDATTGVVPPRPIHHHLLCNANPSEPWTDSEGHVRFTVCETVETPYRDGDAVAFVTVVGKPSGEIVEVTVGVNYE
ncbi:MULTISPECIES: hypothetical protein [Halorubrum]|uniref:Uncharacterized protein n=1 Tax=Halorubrum hochstenium ATCC 700873 TaxID=1227481 RepID=M0FAJ6_9EURY|nr:MULTISPECIES: hypothetical protein [Halorubrum]ELZ55619.1 hypothetical protein C467_09229 [Halorubrum hochstenium ATCC 700873]